MASRRLLASCLRSVGLQQQCAAAATASSSGASSSSGVLAAALPERAWGLPSRARDDEQQQQQQQPALPLFALPSASSSSLALRGLALASSSSRPVPSLMMPTRGLSTLTAASRRPSSALTPLGLGLGLPARSSAQKAAVGPAAQRTFLTEGQLLGTSFLVATDIMFWSGLIGAVVFRRNLIVMLLATEVVMLACNLNFLFASAYFNDMTGVIMSITITTIAACETAIGLALCVTYFHLRSATDVEVLNFLK